MVAGVLLPVPLVAAGYQLPPSKHTEHVVRLNSVNSPRSTPRLACSPGAAGPCWTGGSELGPM